MRLFVAITLLALLAPSIASANRDEAPKDALSMTIVLLDERAAHISWSPAPGSVVYDLYRGASLDDLVLVASVPTTVYVDVPPAGRADIVYVVVSRMISSSIGDDVQQMRGKCIATRGMTGYSVTLAHCMPPDLV